MKHTTVAEIVAFFGRKNFTKLHFNFERVFRVNKTEKIGYSDEMGIRNNGGFAVNVTDDEVCGLSAYARKGFEQVGLGGYFG